MKRISCREIAYYGKPINSLPREELIRALEELAEAIHNCAHQNKKCAELIGIREGLVCEPDA